MTLDEFLEKLAQTPREWRIDHGRFIRRQVTIFGACACPITSLVTDDDGTVVSSGRYRSAGIKLGLDDRLICRIADAADDVEGADQDLRNRLLEATGLA
jgi:hypothetical protein